MEDWDELPGEYDDVDFMTHCMHEGILHKFARESRCLSWKPIGSNRYWELHFKFFGTIV